MKNILKVSLFAMGVVLSSNAFAATGTGHAQTELTNPLTITNQTDVNFGTIAIDPAAGAQSVSMTAEAARTCPSSYVCSGTPEAGEIFVTGAPSSTVLVTISTSPAVLEDDLSNSINFYPSFTGGATFLSGLVLDGSGNTTVLVGGRIDFTGSEPAGTYTSRNGSAYGVSVIY